MPCAAVVPIIAYPPIYFLSCRSPFPMQDARNFLHTDDAVRIGGYIATLESLGIQLVAVRACSSE